MQHRHLCDSADCEPADIAAFRKAYRQRYQGTAEPAYTVIPGPESPGRLRLLRGVGLAAILGALGWVPIVLGLLALRRVIP